MTGLSQTQNKAVVEAAGRVVGWEIPVAGDLVDEGGHVAAGAVDPVEQRGQGWPVRVGGHGGVLLVE
jgi:hypothetical protein